MQDYSGFAERERDGWADPGIVQNYVDRIGPITGEVGEALVATVGTAERDVLDLCCGQGMLTARIAATGARVTGLDFSQPMLDRAAQAAPEATLRRGDAAALPFEDASFDVVLCNFGMMHLPDQPRALHEVRRVLRPGGFFGMTTWAGPEASPAFAAVMGAIRQHADLSKAPPQPDLFAFARAETAGRILTDAGFRLTQHRMVAPAWELSAPGALFEIFATATVGVAMLLKSQSDTVVDAIRDAMTANVAAKCARGSGWRVPVPAAIIVAEPVSCG